MLRTPDKIKITQITVTVCLLAGPTFIQCSYKPQPFPGARETTQHDTALLSTTCSFFVSLDSGATFNFSLTFVPELVKSQLRKILRDQIQILNLRLI